MIHRVNIFLEFALEFVIQNVVASGVTWEARVTRSIAICTLHAISSAILALSGFSVVELHSATLRHISCELTFTRVLGRCSVRAPCVIRQALFTITCHITTLGAALATLSTLVLPHIEEVAIATVLRVARVSTVIHDVIVHG
jgi:hypothetical protein